MFEVSLLHAAFVAPVGLYPEEKVLYNDMEVDISVAAAADLAHLPFIDYAVIYQNVKAAFSAPAGSLESLLQAIYKPVKAQYPDCKINISIRKKNPPLGGRVAASQVSWKEY